ncbi:MAG: shikimate kinase [Neisseriaceae bacterium]|jgi:shikimate kinase|nr:MAG: shikimate kinase [Neisseriaceae bacterium]
MSTKSQNYILVGITGVGKTTIGKQLAKKLRKKFIDLDKYIEEVCGVDIPTIFELEGEAGFRVRESFVLNKVLEDEDDFVLSLGGGCVIVEENRKAIRRYAGKVIQLVADLDVITERLINSPNQRPLLVNQDVRKKVQDLYDARKDFYNEVSTITYNTTDMKQYQVVKMIVSDM